MTAAPEVWLRRFRPVGPPDRQVVVFPHAGGSASYYRPLVRPLSGRAETIAVQYPGRQDRRDEPPVPSIVGLAERISRILGEHTRPGAVFFGHSMGALVAFETARLLDRDGRGPRALVVSGRRAPSVLRPGQRSIREHSDDELVAELIRMNGSDRRLLDDDEMLRVTLPVVRNDYLAVEEYRPEPGATVDCPIVATTGDRDPSATAAEVRAWRHHTTARFDFSSFPGGHFYLTEHVEAIADVIGRSLA